MSLTSAARLYVIFYPVDYDIKRGARQKYFLDSKFLEFGNVFFRNDASTDDRYIICPVLCPG
jgi:hypothetical protein